MKILVTGATGLVGSRFVEFYPNREELLTPPHGELDLTDSSAVKEFLSKTRPEIIINFAAYTNVSEGEEQRDDESGPCWKLNVGGVKNILSALEPKRTRWLQISTDYVFSGRADVPGPYSEEHPTETDSSKLTWYGFTKAEAERLSRQALGPEVAIVRIIYPVRANFPKKLDYLRKPLKLYDEGSLYPLFDDQRITLTFIDEVCLALQKIVEKKLAGVFRVSSPDTTTPFEVVSYLLKKARGVEGVVKRASIEAVTSSVRYQKYGGLKAGETEKRLGIKFRPWKQIVDELVSQGISP